VTASPAAGTPSGSAPGARPAAVVTGMGLVTALGNDPAGFWTRIRAGDSGVSRLERRLDDRLPVRIGAELKDFDPAPLIGPRESRVMDPFVQYGVYAALCAVRAAGLRVGENVAPDRVGAIIGSGIGGATTLTEQSLTLEKEGIGEVTPFLLPMVLPNMVSAQVAIGLGVTGPTMAIATACTTGANAVGEGLRVIQRGEADVMICGAAEAPLYPVGVAAFARMRALSRRAESPALASRPFDRARDGFVLGEGAGVVVLESAAHARARGADPTAALVGYGTSTDAHHMTMPDPDGRGAAACMRRALADAGLAPADIDYVNAHATATKLGDISEARALRSVFGADQPGCSATKSMTAHLLGASAAVEAIVTALAVANDTVPPTVNLDSPDPECDINHVMGGAQSQVTRFAISNSFGFGGHNATLVFAKP
jgi:3-oxoacyl-[acyl-carrier-protein] synthase II